ncbi:hypothetical protein M2G70_07395 [Vibrio vulnificus]|nr:hypothetical protein [Vibrio vulnificus]
MKTYYRTYITTINHPTKGSLYYAGMRSSTYKDPSKDPYFGSGTYVKNFYKKYGRGYFTVQWVQEHETFEDMCQAEIKLIAETRDKHKDKCMNFTTGGLGGRKVSSELVKRVQRARMIQYNKTRDFTEELKQRISNSQKRKPVWDKYKDLYNLWVEHKHPSKERLTSFAHELGLIPETLEVRDTMITSFISDFKSEGNEWITRGGKSKHWEFKDELLKIWMIQPLYPKAFGNKAKELGYPSGNYTRLVKHFQEIFKDELKPYNRNKSSYWEHEEYLFNLWLSDRCSHRAFSTKLVQLGFEDNSCKKLIKHFKKRASEEGLL